MMIPSRTAMSVLLTIGGVIAFANTGCATRGNVALLENELRQQEDRIRGLERDLTSTQSDLQIARQENAALRNQLAQRGEEGLLPEQANLLFRVEGIQFSSYLTSGLDRDDVPGDELLNVLVFPHDEDGSLVKLPGTLEFDVLDLAASPEERELGRWSYSAQETRNSWHSGFLAAGYLFTLNWQRPPKHEELTLHARFTTPDGREFNATKQIRVKLELAETANLAESRPETRRALKPVSATTTEPLPVPDPSDLDPFFPGEPQHVSPVPAQRRGPLPQVNRDGVIETSDRFKEYEIPRFR